MNPLGYTKNTGGVSPPPGRYIKMAGRKEISHRITSTATLNQTDNFKYSRWAPFNPELLGVPKFTANMYLHLYT